MELAAALGQLCRIAVERLPVDGAVVHLMTDQDVVGVAASSGARAAGVGELPFLTGVGPCLDAFRLSRPVLIPDLSATGLRWPGYVGAMIARDVCAVFSLPLQSGAVQLGVLDLYADAAAPLEHDDYSLALAIAGVATQLLLRGDGPEDVIDLLGRVVDHRAEIYQAQGVVMVALGIPLAEALVRLRAHAFSLDIPLIELARLVLAGTTTPGEW